MSRLTPIAREVRGNALWDGIKLVLWLTGGALMSTGALTALIRYLSAIPLDVWLIIGIFVLSLVSLGVSTLIARGRNAAPGASEESRKIPDAIVEEKDARIKELENESAALEKAREYASNLHEESRGEIGRLQRQTETQSIQISARDGELKTLKAKYEWLDEIVEYQRHGLRKYVLVEKCDINLSPLSDGKRYVEFTFHVVNYSMFNVSIPMSEYEILKGSIHFKGDPLSGEAKIIENKVIGLKPYMDTYFKVWQWVNPDEAKDITETLEKVGNRFDFSKAIVYVRADKFIDDEAAKLDLTRGMQNAELENKIVELENTNAELRREITLRQERAKYIEELYLALGACYQAYNQSERQELLSEEAFKNLKMRISHALSHGPNEPKYLFDFYDELPPIPESVDEQKKWIDSQCFKLRGLIEEQKRELSDDI